MSGFLQLESGKIFYEMAGEGDVLLISHAGFVDSRMWDQQFEVFSRNYRVIRFDMPGFGRSDATQGPLSRREILFELMQQLFIDKAILVGCSLGGEICLDFILEHPEMVQALVLVSTVPGGFPFQGEPPQQLLEMIAAMQQGDIEQGAELQAQLWIDGPFRGSGQVDHHQREIAKEMSRISLANQTWLKTDSHPLDPLDPPAFERIKEIHSPVLIIAGELDNPEILRSAEWMKNQIPRARKVILPDCAHLPNMEKPVEFNQAVLEFLK